MKKLVSIAYSEWAFNLSMLLLRVGVGALMISHGYDKLINFAKYRSEFMNFMGIGSSGSLALVVFAEFFCTIFLMIGLFTRAVVVPLLIVMLVAFFKAHKADLFGEGEHAALYLIVFSVILLCGPGKVSVDAMIK
ncbi:MAG: DoxX family protein [Chitinophagaceae bacterium]|nr:DoxX family protein [Chitinophagaceae bacterium]